MSVDGAHFCFLKWRHDTLSGILDSTVQAMRGITKKTRYYDDPSLPSFGAFNNAREWSYYGNARDLSNLAPSLSTRNIPGEKPLGKLPIPRKEERPKHAKTAF